VCDDAEHEEVRNSVSIASEERACVRWCKAEYMEHTEAAMEALYGGKAERSLDVL
jgi:hypothetical protein